MGVDLKVAQFLYRQITGEPVGSVLIADGLALTGMAHGMQLFQAVLRDRVGQNSASNLHAARSYEDCLAENTFCVADEFLHGFSLTRRVVD